MPQNGFGSPAAVRAGGDIFSHGDIRRYGVEPRVVAAAAWRSILFNLLTVNLSNPACQIIDTIVIVSVSGDFVF